MPAARLICQTRDCVLPVHCVQMTRYKAFDHLPVRPASPGHAVAVERSQRAARASMCWAQRPSSSGDIQWLLVSPVNGLCSL
jgi:hypothetical protein